MLANYVLYYNKMLQMDKLKDYFITLCLYRIFFEIDEYDGSLCFFGR